MPDVPNPAAGPLLLLAQACITAAGSSGSALTNSAILLQINSVASMRFRFV